MPSVLPTFQCKLKKIQRKYVAQVLSIWEYPHLIHQGTRFKSRTDPPTLTILLQYTYGLIFYCFSWLFLRLYQDQCIGENYFFAFSTIFRRVQFYSFLKRNFYTIIKKKGQLRYLFVQTALAYNFSKQVYQLERQFSFFSHLCTYCICS